MPNDRVARRAASSVRDFVFNTFSRNCLSSMLVFPISWVSILYNGGTESPRLTVVSLSRKSFEFRRRSSKCHNRLFAITKPFLPECDQKMDVLRFGGEISFTSKALPYSDSLMNFFSNQTMQRVLLSGDAKQVQDNKSTPHHVSTISLNKNLLEEWKMKSLAVGANLPNENDIIVLVQPKGIDMVGVRILPQTILGTTFSTHEYKTSVDSITPASFSVHMPEFQSVLIKDDTHAEGPTFLVWLFNKIARNDELNKDLELFKEVDHRNNENKEVWIEESPPSSNTLLKNKKNHEAFLRVWAEPIFFDTTIPQEVVFKSSISMWIELRFPFFLLRFFPINKSKAEELCSSAIVKSLRMSFQPAFEEFCTAYAQSLGSPLIQYPSSSIETSYIEQDRS